MKNKTNRKKLFKIILFSAYSAIWLFSIIFFRIAMGPTDALGYGIIFMYIISPLSILLASFFTGINNYFGRLKWLLSVGFGIMHTAIEYLTFNLGTMISQNRLNPPRLEMFWTGLVVSLIGMTIGHIIFRAYTNSKKTIENKS